METRLIVLELVLRELDVETTIDTLDDRIRLQKAIYLSQEAGVPLGYRFSWYVHGPYSTGLTSDYYSLQVVAQDEREAVLERRLRDGLIDELERIKPIMCPPDDFPLRGTNWLELVSSLHYLQKRSPRDARSKLETLKPFLYPYVDVADQLLRSVGLTPNSYNSNV